MSTTFSRMSHHLVGTAEIASLLGVSRQYVDRLSRQDPAFPAPEVELASGRVWESKAVEKWAKATGRIE
jgi:predicted DNA-binding transcriptional regulator AlpA